jgi:hypothetical protein
MQVMAEAARVTSIEAVQDFQVFLAKVCQDTREALVSVEMEARRTLDWVRHEQAAFWQRTVRDLHEEVTQAKAALFRKQLTGMSGHKPDLIEERDAVRLAQARLAEAEEKVEHCRRWGPLLQRAIDEYQPPARLLAAMVEGDPPECVVLLEQVLASLEAYVLLTPPSAAPPAATTPPPSGG